MDRKQRILTVMRILWISFALIASLWLSGCATIAPSTPKPAATPAMSWQDREQSLQKLQSWQINGKIAVQTNQDAGSASLDWTQRGGNYQVNITGPLGTHSVKIAGGPGKATI